MPDGKRVVEGESAPDFTLPDQNGAEVSLRDFRGRKIVLYFYLKDFTGGCTKQAYSFKNSHPSFEQEQAVIVGVSTDSVRSHRRFAEATGIPFILLSDPDASVAKLYGVYREKEAFGETYRGVVRSTFLIDKDLRIRKIFRGVEVQGHDRVVLNEVSALP